LNPIKAPKFCGGLIIAFNCYYKVMYYLLSLKVVFHCHVIFTCLRTVHK